MKALKLTEKQKDKLIKMCNKLFPDVNWHFWESDDESYISNQMIGYNQTYILGKNTKDYSKRLEIYWFEFCLKYLIPKLVEKQKKESIYCDISELQSLCTKDNFIDILYFQFKKGYIK